MPIVDRFDRTPTGQRIGYVSALTMREAREGDQRSYFDIAETIEELSPRATNDIHQLWRRIVYYVMVSNTDEHLRNHAFLHVGRGAWRLSPAFDVNPDPAPGLKDLSTAINEVETEARVDLARSERTHDRTELVAIGTTKQQRRPVVETARSLAA